MNDKRIEIAKAVKNSNPDYRVAIIKNLFTFFCKGYNVTYRLNENNLVISSLIVFKEKQGAMQMELPISKGAVCGYRVCEFGDEASVYLRAPLKNTTSAEDVAKLIRTFLKFNAKFQEK